MTLKHYDDAAARPDRRDHATTTTTPLSLEEQWWASDQATPPGRHVRTAAEVGPSTAVTFPPKRGARRLMSIVVLMVLVAAAGAGYLAYDRPTSLSIGIAATMGALLLVTWAIRAGTPLTRLSVEGGQLDVRQGGLHLKFDLSSQFTPVEVQGTPGHRDWRVLFGRGAELPFVVDASLVDPTSFMDVLQRYRPR